MFFLSEGPKLEAEGRERGVVLGEVAASCFPTSYVVWGVPQNLHFGAFWDLRNHTRTLRQWFRLLQSADCLITRRLQSTQGARDQKMRRVSWSESWQSHAEIDDL